MTDFEKFAEWKQTEEFSQLQKQVAAISMKLEEVSRRMAFDFNRKISIEQDSICLLTAYNFAKTK